MGAKYLIKVIIVICLSKMCLARHVMLPTLDDSPEIYPEQMNPGQPLNVPMPEQFGQPSLIEPMQEPFEQTSLNTQQQGSFGQPSLITQQQGSFGEPFLNTQQQGSFGQPSQITQQQGSFGQPSQISQQQGSFGQPFLNTQQQGSFGQLPPLQKSENKNGVQAPPRSNSQQNSNMPSVEALSEELKQNPIDPNSFSRPDLCRVKHIQWNASVNFEDKIIDGFVELTVDKLSDNTDELILDTLDLTIHQIKDIETGQSLNFQLSQPIKIFGAKLAVKLLPKKRSIVRIYYKTSPKAAALQWLKPEFTVGKRKPYLFSQCQAIKCRSIVPCQDTPATKATYSATITVPKDMEVLLSAEFVGQGAISGNGLTKAYSFHQKVPIVSYLIAIVVGDLVSKRIGPRTQVWTEKEILEKSAYEFADTEKMIKTAENIVGPYVWGKFDLLILPPSFPFGGMENPCLSFITPTILAGDRSLANLIAHELSHSWTGNLVTNKNWNHYWLNEGFTKFLERKIVGRLSGGEPYREFQAMEGFRELKDAVKTLGANHPFTKLILDTRGIDPDDSYSRVPYEKGHTFLFFLEKKLGGPQVFDPFLKAYMNKFKFTSIITQDFIDFVYEFFKDKKNILETIDWNLWLNGTGMPPITPDYDKTFSKKSTELAKRWMSAQDSDLSKFNSKDISTLDVWQKMDFLDQLIEANPVISKTKVESITQLYGFKSCNNNEVRFRWLSLDIKTHWKPCISDAISFISSTGRMSFIKPIYKALYDWEETRQLAINTFKAHSNEMMRFVAMSLAEKLHVQFS